MATVTKLKIKFGPGGSVRTFQVLAKCSNAEKIEKSETEDVKPRKREPKELEEEEVQANKKQKLDCDLSSQCFAVLKSLRDHEFAWIFNEPVDPVTLKIPDYFSIISRPMDFGTIKLKLLKNAYSNAEEFAEDVRLTFNNAMIYNPLENAIHKMAKELKEIFEVRWASLSLKKKKIEPLEADCSKQSSPETSWRFSKELTIPKAVKLQIKKDTPVATPKTLSTKLRIKKLNQGLGVSSSVEVPSKGTNFVSVPLANKSDPHSNGLVNLISNEKNGSVSSELDKPLDTELKTTALPATPPLPPEKALRAAMLKSQFADTILKAKHRKVLDKSSKADLIRIKIEKEQMERTQRQEKARIEAEIRAAKMAIRKQQRERERLKLEQMEKNSDFEENNFEKEFAELCGVSSSMKLNTAWVLEMLGLYFKNDEEIDEPYVLGMDELEEGEIMM